MEPICKATRIEPTKSAHWRTPRINQFISAVLRHGRARARALIANVPLKKRYRHTVCTKSFVHRVITRAKLADQ
ncbi:hypothetical protein NECAME_05887 [Necator americanus]|uniref:Uncharacterized protein n=1 Tax=Necator americanus TaxID=51031 RepID=W2TXI9_NECAM|nr:hypothetical protein NECAME_05887 [Necator americanus]ETN86583.1 hypothetical protein NECAME_05887 [Necator americanus]